MSATCCLKVCCRPSFVSPNAMMMPGTERGATCSKVDGQDLDGVDLHNVMELILGPPATEVTLVMERKGTQRSGEGVVADNLYTVPAAPHAVFRCCCNAMCGAHRGAGATGAALPHAQRGRPLDLQPAGGPPLPDASTQHGAGNT